MKCRSKDLLNQLNIDQLKDQTPQQKAESINDALLQSLEYYKLHSPLAEEIPNWFLKEYADKIADPITKILNASFKEQRVPSIWKLADLTPLPKNKPLNDITKDLRPVSLTLCISKIADDFVVNDYLKPAVLKVIDKNQFGAIPNSSTTLALTSMVHNWLKATDGTGSTIRTLLFDYRKAFDLIDYNVLANKICL